jgi:nicotinamidase-related amidase
VEITIALKKPKNTALLVVDLQNGVVKEAYERNAVVAKIRNIVDKARRERVPVIWVQHSDEQLTSGSDDWRIVPELAPGDAEPLVEKNYGDSFEDTTLATVLSTSMSGGWSLSAHRPTRASARQSTARSLGDMMWP